MAHRPYLSTPARDAWRLAAAAIEAGLVEAARALADQSLRLSGWDPYLQGFTFGPRAIYYSELIPPACAYYERVDAGDRRLLVHPNTALFVAELHCLEPLFDLADSGGGGLLPLDTLMATVVLHEITPPDDASALIV